MLFCLNAARMCDVWCASRVTTWGFVCQLRHGVASYYTHVLALVPGIDIESVKKKREKGAAEYELNKKDNQTHVNRLFLTFFLQVDGDVLHDCDWDGFSYCCRCCCCWYCRRQYFFVLVAARCQYCRVCLACAHYFSQNKNTFFLIFFLSFHLN